MFQPDGTSAGVKPLLLAPTQSLTLHTVSPHKSRKINAVATTMFSYTSGPRPLPRISFLPAGECPHSTWFFS